jgi:ribosomal small subunit protein bTHX
MSRVPIFNTGSHNVGKGDKRTFRGKVFKGSHGKSRPRKAKKSVKKPA